MRAGLIAVITAMVLSALGMPCLAHHSVKRMYNTGSLVTVRGEVIRVCYGNPHVWFDLRVKNETGEVLTQRVEIATPRRLLQTSFDRSLLNVGIEVAVDAWSASVTVLGETVAQPVTNVPLQLGVSV